MVIGYLQYNTIQYNMIQYNTIQRGGTWRRRDNGPWAPTIQYDTIQYNTIQYDTIQYNVGERGGHVVTILGDL